MEKSRRVNLNDATHAEALYSPSGPTTAGTPLQSIYNPPRHYGEVGWICPVCGRGNAPSTAYCSCKSGQITYGSGIGYVGATIKSTFDDAIPCNAELNEYISTSVSSNCSDRDSGYGAHFDTHN